MRVNQQLISRRFHIVDGNYRRVGGSRRAETPEPIHEEEEEEVPRTVRENTVNAMQSREWTAANGGCV